MRAKGLILGCIAIVVMLVSAPVTASDDVSEMRETIKNLQARLDKLESEQDDTIQREEMTKMMKEILEDAKAAPALPKWMENLKFYGDLRLRFEAQREGERRFRNEADNVYDDPKTRNRFRFRLRFGIKKTWWDNQMEVGFRLASGSSSNPTSTNQTMEGVFSEKPVWIDLAYAKYQPKWLEGFLVAGGKMKNPIRSRTLMTWDSDVNPEGFVATYQSQELGDFKPYVTVGWWSVEENATSRSSASGTTSRDVWVMNYGAGFDWEIVKGVKWFFGGTFYDWSHYDIVGEEGFDDGWVNSSGQPASDMGAIELTTKVKWEMFDLPFQTWVSWVHNCEENYAYNVPGYADTDGQKDFENSNDAFGVGIKVGKNKKKGDWSVGYSYVYIEAHSVTPLTDSDFGGPNRQGHIFGGTYNIDDFLTVGGKMIINEPIHSFSTDSEFYNIDSDTRCLFQLDMVWKF
jgi:hypothetical protein